MEYARIPDKYFRRLHQPLTHIFKPWWQLPHQESPAQNIEVFSGCIFLCAQRSRKISSVPNLTVVVGYHDPETLEGTGRNANTELRNIPFEKGLDKIHSPIIARP